MNKLAQIIGGEGVLTSQIGDAWIIEIDSPYASSSTSVTLPSDPIATTSLSYTSKHGEQVIPDTWAANSLGDGLQITVQTGVCYEHDGDRTIYGFVRDFTFNAFGQLVTVSAERRIVIDIPEAC